MLLREVLIQNKPDYSSKFIIIAFPNYCGNRVTCKIKLIIL